MSMVYLLLVGACCCLCFSLAFRLHLVYIICCLLVWDCCLLLCYRFAIWLFVLRYELFCWVFC